MKKLYSLVALFISAALLNGCGMFGGSKVYDGSEAYGQAHPDQVQPPSYMDPEQGYSTENH